MSDWTPVDDDNPYFVAVDTIADFVRRRSGVGDVSADTLLSNFVERVKEAIDRDRIIKAALKELDDC
jgi:hypothetical protein